MSAEFSRALQAFVAAGNTVVGQPKRVVSIATLKWKGIGHTLTFGEGVDIRTAHFNF